MTAFLEGLAEVAERPRFSNWRGTGRREGSWGNAASQALSLDRARELLATEMKNLQSGSNLPHLEPMRTPGTGNGQEAGYYTIVVWEDAIA